MDFTRTIGNLTFEHPFMNAAGKVKMVQDFDKLLPTPVSAIVVGSIMPQFHEGNKGETFWPTPGFALNSLEIPCQGQEYYQRYLPEMVELAKAAGKHLVFNIAGFKPADYIILARLAVESGVEIIEVNFGCPNLVDEGIQKPIFSYDIEMMGEILSHIYFEIKDSDVVLWVKVSPQADPYQIPRMGKLLVNYDDRVVAVVTSNTFPNGFGFKDNGKTMIDPNNGLGGISGPAMYPIGLGQVRQWRTALDKLKSQIIVIGVGGIENGRQVLEYLDAGAALVQIGTAFFKDGNVKIFEDIAHQMVAEVERRETAWARSF